MLYLSRKIGESIIINNTIELKVVEVRGKNVKLGFQFPPDVTVLRKELHDKISEENRSALAGDDMMEALFGMAGGGAEESHAATNADEKDE